MADLLARGLVRLGHDVRRVVREPAAAREDPPAVEMGGFPGDVLARNAFGWDVSGWRLARHLRRFPADVVHFHDSVVAFGVNAVRAVARDHPVVLTIHDKSSFTGGCIVAEGCTRYRQGCGRCPLLGRWPLVLPIDRTRATFRASHALAASPGVLAVAPSRTYASLAREGAFMGGDVRVLDSPVDDETFGPDRRADGRQRLGLGPDDRAVLAVATDFDIPWKGLGQLALAVPRLFETEGRWKLFLAGRSSNLPDGLAKLGASVVPLGPISDRQRLAEVYAAADVFLLPSLEENSPLTIAEALACGTPVVAHRVGGVAEMFEEGAHGWSVPTGDADSMAAAARRACAELGSEVARAAIRRYAAARYGLASVARRYEDVYHSAVAARAGVGARDRT